MAVNIVRYISPETLTSLSSFLSSEELAILDEINQKVAAAESLEGIIEFIFERTAELFPCDRIGIAFLDGHDKRMVSRYVSARYKPVYLTDKYSEGLSGSSLGDVIEKGQIRIISDLEKYLEKKPKSRSTKLLIKEGVRSNLTCPLSVDNRRVGVMFRSSREVNSYGDREVLLHSMIAERLSQAVEKAFRIDQLQAANSAYMEMLGFASHELKSPLGSLVMDGEMMLGGYLGELTDRQEKKIESMVRRAKALIDTTRDYLDLVHLEEGRLKLSAKSDVVLAKEVLEPVLEMLKPQAEAKRSTLVCDCKKDLSAECDPELMKIVFMNLVGNAIKYGREGGEVKITLDVKDKRFSGSVWNSGAGFPKEQQSGLFKRFSRLSVPEHKAVRGTGVGLYLVWQIIELHGGKIRADSEYGAWAEFSFEIPQPIAHHE